MVASSSSFPLLLLLLLSFAHGGFSFVLSRNGLSSLQKYLRVTASGVDESLETCSEEWWKDFKLEHGYIAEKVRSDFAILSRQINDDIPLVYLDSAATSQKPQQVLHKLEQYYKSTNSNVHRGAHTLSREATAEYEQARDEVANFINAYSRNECVFTKGATEAINLVANTYGRQFIKEGDEIIFTQMEHHSNIVPWQMLAEQTGCVLKFILLDAETGTIDHKQFESLLSDKTKLVSFQHVSNVLASVNPVQDMVKTIRQKSPNAKILLDACQSVPHMKVDVQKLGVDFLAASGHKMCGPTGIGFLWGREDLLNEMPPFHGGGEMIDHVTLQTSTYAKAPGRFEAGTPSIAQAIGLGEAIKYLNQIGMDKIEAYEHELADYLYKRLAAVEGVNILGPKEDRAALCAFTTDSVHPSDLSSFLDMDGVAIRAGHHCCQPLHQALGHSHSARASLYFYNTKEDIDKFIGSLEGSIGFFKGLGSSKSEDEAGSGEDDFVPFI